MDGTSVDQDLDAFEFALKLHVSTSDKQQIDKHFQSILKCMERDLKSLETHLRMVKELSFIHIRRISETEEHEIVMHFVVVDLSELHKFYKVSQKGKKSKQNELSACITKFACEQNLELAAGFQSTTKLVFNISMPIDVYCEGQKALTKDEDDSDDDPEENDQYGTSLTNQQPKFKTDGQKESSHSDLTLAVKSSDASESNGEHVKSLVSFFEDGQKKGGTTDSDQFQQETSTNQEPLQDDGKNKQPNERQAASSSQAMTTRETDQVLKIKKTFLIPVPTNGGKVVKCVRMMTESRFCDMNAELFKSYGNIYRVTLEIPANFPADTTYQYEATYSYFKHIYSRKSTDEIFCSQRITLGSYNVIRDSWQPLDAESLLAHLQHLSLHCSFTVDIGEICCQIQQLFEKQIYFDLAASNVLYILSKAMRSPERLVCSIILAILYSIAKRDKFILPLQLRNATLANQCFQSLRETSIEKLPTACRRHLETFCIDYSSIALGKRLCPLGYMDLCFDFLGKDRISDYANTCIKRKEPLITSDKDMLEEANRLCRKLCRLGVSETAENKNKCTNLLGQILRNVPFAVAVDVYQNMLVNLKEHVLKEMLYASVVSQIQPLLNLLKRQRNLQNILKHWSLINDIEDIRTKYKSCFEQAVLDVLGFTKINDETNIESAIIELCEKYGFFECIEIQDKIIRAIADSSNRIVLLLLIPLSKQLAFKTAFEKIHASVYTTWIANVLKTLKGDTDDFPLYSIIATYSQFLEVQAVSSRPEVIKEIDSVICATLEKLEIKDLLRKINATNIGEFQQGAEQLLSGVIQTVLGRNYKHHKPHELLVSLCVTDGKLQVNSKVTADTICSIIDCYFGQSKSSAMQDFLSILPSGTFWHLVLHVEGKQPYVSIVEQHSTVLRIQTCIDAVIEMLNSSDVTYDFVTDIRKDMQGTKLLLSCRGMSKTNAEKVLKQLNADYVLEKRKLLAVLSVIRNVENQPGFPDISVLGPDVEAIKADIEHCRITARQVQSKKGIWKRLGSLPKLCESLEPVIASRVFWNVCKDPVIHAFKKNALVHEADVSAEEDIRFLFECNVEEVICIDDESDGHKNKCKTSQEVVEFLKILHDVGLTSYRNAWSALKETNDPPMSLILNMIQSINVKEEFAIIESVMKMHLTEVRKNALTQLCTRKIQSKNIETVKSFLKSVSLYDSLGKELYQALEASNDILKGSLVRFTFKEACGLLDTLFSVTEGLSDYTIQIMYIISRSTELLKFLESKMNDEFRNLIDAVEEFSEQQVDASTVSSLIEVKRFLHPVLSCIQGKEKNVKLLFGRMDKQTRIHGENAKYFPAKITECADKINNLKTLYYNVANRGEQTKEKISNILRKGKFSFGHREESDRVHFEVSYTPKKQRKVVKDEAALTDLRSRALLLMNSEWSAIHSNLKKDELYSFVETVDVCSGIRDSLQSLHTSGNIHYVKIKITCERKDLPKKQKKLENDYKVWIHELQTERDEYYLLNFVQGFEIQALYKFSKDGTEEVAVENTLKYIHPELQLIALEKAFKETVKVERSVLAKIGHALHTAHTGLSLYMRPKAGIYSTKARLTDFVQRGKLLVAKLQEDSLYVAQTVLTLYINTTHRFPEPFQIIFCDCETQWSDIQLLLKRCVGSYSFYDSVPLFCIANVEMLPSDLQFKLVAELKQLSASNNFLLAVVCRGTKFSPFLGELQAYVSSVQCISDQKLYEIMSEYFSDVCTYISDVAGLGKTTEIYRTASALKPEKGVETLHLSNPFQKREILERLKEMEKDDFNILHIDVYATQKPREVDTFLFELIVLRFASEGKTAVFLPNKNVAIEISNTANGTLRNSLHTLTLFKKKSLQWENFNNFIVSREICSPVQVVCQYLKILEEGRVDSVDLSFGESNQPLPILESECQKLLRKYVATNSDISFSIVNNFVNVLADQLKKMSCSVYFKVSRIIDMVGFAEIPTVRSTLLKEMIDASLEFALRSVNACRNSQFETFEAMEQNRNPETNEVGLQDLCRVNAMIRWEESNHLIYVFHNQNIQTLSPMYRRLENVPQHIQKFFESQIKRQLQDFGTMSQTQLQTILQRVARTSNKELHSAVLNSLTHGYALTSDNLLKMVLIMMRVKANIPVIIMGETGCGKTSLIRYLATICEVELHVMNIHAGVQTNAIVTKVIETNQNCMANLNNEQWLFFDEINTSENIGLLCDIICHHRCFGVILSPNLVILGACNPYRLRSKETILTAGLHNKVKTDELSKLVYRVYPLPETMVDYVWDFGSLSDQDEKMYIDRMLDDCPLSKEHYRLFCDLVSVSQSFVREREMSTCGVSLRDVQRCKILVRWFLTTYLKHRKEQKSRTDEGSNESPLQQRQTYIPLCEDTVLAMILSLVHCYHSRFSDKRSRIKYRKCLSKQFMIHKKRTLSSDNIYRVISSEQRFIIDRMELPAGTAKNTALQENVFILLVCILNKLPIFIVGKPGCSKSLAMQIIRSNLRGKDSKDLFLKYLPQLLCVSFQGSESSTSDGIIKVFEKAEACQTENGENEVLSAVLLDEIGLAEISRFNPLKVLHNLLEPEGKCYPNVAVVGISNWALDASKMNRAIHLSRPDMDKEELYETGISISESFSEEADIYNDELEEGKENCLSTSDIRSDLYNIASAYSKYSAELRFQNFHGLRDFYSFVKFVASKFAKTKKDYYLNERANIMKRGIERNLGGLPEEKSLLNDCFSCCFNVTHSEDSSVVDLIKENISDPLARHLMIITKGESVFSIVEDALQNTNTNTWEKLIGSQFEEDRTDDYNYRILSKIILCMEQGIVLVLKDLESVYGSLYDMLNQHYTVISEKKNCRVALGAYSNPFCEVADSFRCIVLVDSGKVDYADPPFLNRFEKQFLSFADILYPDQADLVRELEHWISWFIDLTGDKSFSKHDIFPNYNEELIVSLVLKVCRNEEVRPNFHFEKCKRKLLKIMKPEAIIRLQRCSNPEMREQAKTIQEKYFRLPLHTGISDFIQHQMKQLSGHERCEAKVTTIFTNSNIHTSSVELISKWSIQVEKLGTFKSEKHLSKSIQQFWSDPSVELLFVQCNAVSDEQHILLTKSIIERHMTEYESCQVKNKMKLAYLVIHLEKGCSSVNTLSQLNFLCGWKLVMIDCLECREIPLSTLCSKPIKTIIQMKRPLRDCIQRELFWAFTRIKYGPHGRSIDSISDILQKMISQEFLNMLEERLLIDVSRKHGHFEDVKWQADISCDVQALQTSACYIDALEKYVLNEIKMPLAKLIYQLESLGAIDCYFIQDELSDTRQVIWRNLFVKSNVVSIENVQDETGPESYKCETAKLHLHFPFSLFIFCRIEATQDEFLDDILKLKSRESEKDENGDVSDDAIEELVRQQEGKTLLDLQSIPFEDLNELKDCYVLDFCNIVTHSMCTSFERNVRTACMKWALSQKMSFESDCILEIIVRAHCFFWIHETLFRSVLHLLELCRSVFADSIFHLIEEFNENVIMKRQLPLQHFSVQTSNDDGKHGSKPEKLEVQTIAVAVKKTNRLTNSKHLSNSEQSIHTYDAQFTQDARLRSNSDSTLIIGSFTRHENILSIENLVNDTSVGEDERTLIVSPVTKQEEIESEHLCEEVSSIFDHDDKMLSDPFEKFVSFVCSNILPNSKNLRKFGNIYSWQNEVETILTVAAEVSRMPRALHALRFCNDISGEIVIPLCLDDECMAAIGNAIGNENLYSEKVFRSVMDVVETAIVLKEEIRCQKVLSQYLVRCFYFDQFSSAYQFIFGLVLESKLPENGIEVLRPPFYFILEQEKIEDSMIGYKILSPGCKMANACYTETEDILLKNKFVGDLNTFLKDIANQNMVNHPFVILIVDLLQELYETDTKDLHGEYLTHCGYVIQQGDFGLRFVAAVAYFRSKVSKIEYTLETDCKKLLGNINAVLTGVKEKHIGESMMAFFIKAIGSNKTLSSIITTCRKLQDRCSSLKEIKWTPNYIQTCTDHNPLSIYVQDHIRQATKLMKYENESKADDNMDVLLQLNTKHSCLLLYSVIGQEFYFPRFLEKQIDTKTTVGHTLVEKFLSKDHSHNQNMFLKCLIGETDFACNELLSSENRTVSHFCLNSVLITTYALVLSQETFASDQMPLLPKCLLLPTQLQSDFIPGFPDDRSTRSELSILHDCKARFFNCKCGQRIAFHTEMTQYRCFVCKSNGIQEKSYWIDADVHMEKEHRKGYVNFETLAQSNLKVRFLSPVTCNILYILIKGGLLGSLALGITQETDLKAELQIPGSVDRQLWTEIMYHWNRLKEMLNITDYYLGIFLHEVILQCKEMLFEDHISFRSANERADWESCFDLKIGEIVGEKFKAVITHIRRCDRIFYQQDDIFEHLIYEANDISSTDETEMSKKLPMLFRVTNIPTKADFITKLDMQKKSFQFLKHSVLNEARLRLPIHIYNIIQWHLTAVDAIGYSMRRDECDGLTVAEFIRKISSKNQKAVFEDKFRKFKSTWIVLKEQFESIGNMPKIDHVHIQSKLSKCLLITKQSPVFAVLSVLVSVQNQFIDESLLLAADCKHLQYLSKGEGCYSLNCVQITEAIESQLIDISFDWTEIFSHESQCSLKYGEGRDLMYDFSRIEQELVIHLLVGKCFIEFDFDNFPEFNFVDTFYMKFDSLLNDVRLSVQQEQLPDNVLFSLTQFSDVDTSELINHTGMLLTLLKRIACEPSMPLIKFVKERKHLIGKEFPFQLLPSPESSICICHIVSLHETLEELCATCTIDALLKDTSFCDRIDNEQTKILQQLPQTNIQHAVHVLKATKRFVYRCLSVQIAHHTQKLITFLQMETFWPHGYLLNGVFQVDDKDKTVYELFPERILVGHVLSIIECLDTVIHEQRLKTGKQKQKTDSVTSNPQRDRRRLIGRLSRRS